MGSIVVDARLCNEKNRSWVEVPLWDYKQWVKPMVGPCTNWWTISQRSDHGNGSKGSCAYIELNLFWERFEVFPIWFQSQDMLFVPSNSMDVGLLTWTIVPECVSFRFLLQELFFYRKRPLSTSGPEVWVLEDFGSSFHRIA